MSYCQFSVRNDCVTRLDCLKQSSPPYHLGLVRKSFMCGLVDFILNFSGFIFQIGFLAIVHKISLTSFQ